MKHPATLQKADSRTEPDENEQIIWGAGNIARVINRDPRAVYHLHAKNLLPTKSVGGRLCALKSKLLAIAG